MSLSYTANGMTGQGTTVTFSGAGVSACVRSIQLPTWSMEAIDSSCLSDTGFGKKIAGDLVDAGTVQVTVTWVGDAFAVPDGTLEEMVITFPALGDGAGNSGSLKGSGFVSEVSLRFLTP